MKREKLLRSKILGRSKSKVKDRRLKKHAAAKKKQQAELRKLTRGASRGFTVVRQKATNVANPRGNAKIFSNEKLFLGSRWKQLPNWAQFQRIKSQDCLSYRFSRDLCYLHDYIYTLIMLAKDSPPDLKSSIKNRIRRIIYSVDFSNPVTFPYVSGKKRLTSDRIPRWLALQYLKTF